MKSIGIAICAFYGHILPLKKALESIEGQTKKPDMVIVSCSSCEQKDIPYTPQMYSFPLMIITHRDKKNAAQNRNFAAELLQTDIICFFDADDIMHPQRIEIIHNCFMTYDIKLFLHNTQLNIPDTIVPYTDCTYILNKLGMCRFGSTILQMYMPNMIIANGHASISADVFKEIKFNDTKEYYTKEDTKFCTDIIVKYQNQTAYCNNVLSYYFPSGTGGYIC